MAELFYCLPSSMSTAISTTETAATTAEPTAESTTESTATATASTDLSRSLDWNSLRNLGSYLGTSLSGDLLTLFPWSLNRFLYWDLSAVLFWYLLALLIRNLDGHFAAMFPWYILALLDRLLYRNLVTALFGNRTALLFLVIAIAYIRTLLGITGRAFRFIASFIRC